MLKKIVIFLSVFAMTGLCVVMANDDYKSQILYYNSVKTCTPGDFILSPIDIMGYRLNRKFSVYGKTDNKCSIREHSGNFDLRCKLPMDIARRYADEGIKTLNLSIKNGSAYSSYNNQIINDTNYCQSN